MTADVVIFGSGFAAYELASQLVGQRRSVIVIERGSADPIDADPELSRVPFQREPIQSGGFDFGAEVPAAFDGLPRYIGLGGTSQLWSGKWRRLDTIDMRRSHGDRKWPIEAAELTNYYDRVAADYGWPDWSTDAFYPSHRSLITDHGLRAIDIYEERPPLRLQSRWAELQANGQLRMLCDATPTRAIQSPADGSLQRVTIEQSTGALHVEADVFIVAAGGIESVHLSDRLRQGDTEATGVDRTYHGFMDHPKAFVGRVSLLRNRPLVDYLLSTRIERHRIIALSLSEDPLEAEGLGNHSVFLWEDETSTRSRMLRIAINLEQFPEDDNQVKVGAAACVKWRLSHRTWTDYSRFVQLLAPRLEKLIGRVELDPSPRFRGASHHIGALPMSGDAATSDVDPQCAFRDLSNLYCVSSAVFPIGGSAHPTMTVVALARRLADRLVSRE